MRGHGTYLDDEDVVASVSGQIERVNKLVSVRALKTRWAAGGFGMMRAMLMNDSADTHQRSAIWSLGG